VKEKWKEAWDAYPSQDNEGYQPDRAGFKCGWYAAHDHQVDLALQYVEVIEERDALRAEVEELKRSLKGANELVADRWMMVVEAHDKVGRTRALAEKLAEACANIIQLRDLPPSPYHLTHWALAWAEIRTALAAYDQAVKPEGASIEKTPPAAPEEPGL
jgi:hypothetical protein